MSLRQFAIAITLLCSTACSSSYSSSPSSPSTPTTPSSTSTGPSVTAGIAGGASLLTSTAFGAPLTIATGTTVAWTNNDSIAHTSTADGSQWNSGNINPGQTFRFTFATAGRYTYHCTIHPGMVGTVTVQ